MWVLEIYQSKQGEGLWTGKYSIFVRMLGCPLHCRYCDTPYARSRFSDEEGEIGADLSPEEVAGRILLLDLPHVVLTGGEPMLSPEIVSLTRILKEFDYQITIETSGTVDVPVHCDLMSISPKLSNSTPENGSDDGNHDQIRQHEEGRHRPEVVQNLIFRYNHQLKFVVDTSEDFAEIENYLSQLQGVVPGRVLMMPQAVDAETMARKAEWIVPYCEEKGFQYCPRMQIIWYGNTRRT